MKSITRHIRPLAFAVSIALFICLLKRTGSVILLDDIRLFGWGMVVLILLGGVKQFLRSSAWSYCVHANGPRPLALQFLGPRLMGEALNDLTPAGPLVGEPAKIVAVSKIVTPEAGASSLVLENLIYALSAIIFIVGGVVLALVALVALRSFRWMGAGVVVLLLASIALVCWAVTRRVLLVDRAFGCLKRLGLRFAFLERHYKSLRTIERTIYDFLLNSRRKFVVVLAIEIATNTIGILEAYLILKVTAAHASVFAAYLVESASRAIQLVFPFVPLGLGVQEGAAASTLHAVGYAAAQGVSLAVIRKIRNLFWAAVGLVFLARYSFFLPVAEKDAMES